MSYLNRFVYLEVKEVLLGDDLDDVVEVLQTARVEVHVHLRAHARRDVPLALVRVTDVRNRELAAARRHDPDPLESIIGYIEHFDAFYNFKWGKFKFHSNYLAT